MVRQQQPLPFVSGDCVPSWVWLEPEGLEGFGARALLAREAQCGVVFLNVTIYSNAFRVAPRWLGRLGHPHNKIALRSSGAATGQRHPLERGGAIGGRRFSLPQAFI